MRDMILGKLGVLEAGETASAEDAVLVYEALDLRLKEIHRLGIFWLKVDEVPLEFTVTANVNSASASVDILFPIALTIRDGDHDKKVDIVGALEYAKISDKEDTGLPTRALWKGSAEFWFHPIPITGTTAHLTYQKFADDTAASTAPDIEVSMMRWMRDLVAYDLADHFGLPEDKIKRFAVESVVAERNIRKLSAERKDYEPVAVEDYYRSDREETDY
jgi:hypothetical protein